MLGIRIRDLRVSSECGFAGQRYRGKPSPKHGRYVNKPSHREHGRRTWSGEKQQAGSAVSEDWAAEREIRSREACRPRIVALA